MLEDEGQFKNIINEISDSLELFLSIEIYKNIINITNKRSQNSIIKFAIFIFNFYFNYNIKLLLREIKESFNNPPTPLEINIDDDNYHINFILSFSNLRAKNYYIEPSNFLNTKEIAGNIIPAIASTTAAVTGIVCLQIYTLLQTNDIKSLKSISFNLAVSEFDLFTPEEKRYITDIPKTERSCGIKAIPGKFTIWDKIDIYGPNLSAKKIIEYFKDNYNVNIENINYGDITISSALLDEDEDLEKSIETLMSENTKFVLNERTKYIPLEITGSYDDGEYNISMPTLRYVLKGKQNNSIIN